MQCIFKNHYFIGRKLHPMGAFIIYVRKLLAFSHLIAGQHEHQIIKYPKTFERTLCKFKLVGRCRTHFHIPLFQLGYQPRNASFHRDIIHIFFPDYIGYPLHYGFKGHIYPIVVDKKLRRRNKVHRLHFFRKRTVIFNAVFAEEYLIRLAPYGYRIEKRSVKIKYCAFEFRYVHSDLLRI